MYKKDYYYYDYYYHYHYLYDCDYDCKYHHHNYIIHHYHVLLSLSLSIIYHLALTFITVTDTITIINIISIIMKVHIFATTSTLHEIRHHSKFHHLPPSFDNRLHVMNACVTADVRCLKTLVDLGCFL